MSTTTTRTRRSSEDWENLAVEILPQLQSGASLDNFRSKIGSNEDALKTTLAKMGFDPHGNPLTLKEISARNRKTLANRVAKERRNGTSWWLLQAQTDESYTKLVAVLKEHGFGTDGQPVATNGAS